METIDLLGTAPARVVQCRAPGREAGEICMRTIVEGADGEVTHYRRGLPADISEALVAQCVAIVSHPCNHHGGGEYSKLAAAV